MKKENLSNKKGITLIALVVTIIVLLILAGVTIATLMGENGILTRANSASVVQIEGRVDEEVKLAVQSAKMYAEEMSTKTATGWLASENIGETSTQDYAEMTTEQKMTIIGQMRADLTKGKGYTEIKNNGNGTIKVTYQTDEYKQATNDSNAKIEKVIKITNNTFEINQTVVDTEVTIVSMYEDLAGDEDGATEGMIHIGDYVNYNPNPKNMETSAMTQDNGYKYVSTNAQTGLGDAIAANYNGWLGTSTLTSQDFTVQPDIKWRVLGMDGDYLMIIPETPIGPDEPVTYGPSFFLYGAQAYENCITEMTNISKIYANGEWANKTKTRGMTIEDVNKITGLIADGERITPEITEYYEEWGKYPYGSSYNLTGWTPSAWLKATATERENNIGVTELTGTTNGYGYSGDEANLKTANTNSIRYKFIFGDVFGDGNKKYWLASKGVLANYGVFEGAGSLSYAPGCVGNGKAFSCGGDHFITNGDMLGDSSGICPVVYLKPEVPLTALSTTEDGITTWEIGEGQTSTNPETPSEPTNPTDPETPSEPSDPINPVETITFKIYDGSDVNEYKVETGKTWRQWGEEQSALTGDHINPSALGLGGDYLATVKNSNWLDNCVPLDEPISAGNYYCCVVVP